MYIPWKEFGVIGDAEVVDVSATSAASASAEIDVKPA